MLLATLLGNRIKLATAESMASGGTKIILLTSVTLLMRKLQVIRWPMKSDK